MNPYDQHFGAAPAFVFGTPDGEERRPPQGRGRRNFVPRPALAEPAGDEPARAPPGKTAGPTPAQAFEMGHAIGRLEVQKQYQNMLMIIFAFVLIVFAGVMAARVLTDVAVTRRLAAIRLAEAQA